MVVVSLFTALSKTWWVAGSLDCYQGKGGGGKIDEPVEYSQFNPVHHVNGHLNPSNIPVRGRIIPEKAMWQICLNDHVFLLLPHGNPGHRAKRLGESSQGHIQHCARWESS